MPSSLDPPINLRRLERDFLKPDPGSEPLSGLLVSKYSNNSPPFRSCTSTHDCWPSFQGWFHHEYRVPPTSRHEEIRSQRFYLLHPTKTKRLGQHDGSWCRRRSRYLRAILRRFLLLLLRKIFFQSHRAKVQHYARRYEEVLGEPCR